MKDQNYPLQKAYNTALDGITYDGNSVPAFYQQADDNYNNYIIFTPITNTDLSTKSSSDTNSLMQVTIYTYSPGFNDGKALGAISTEVFNRVYNTPITMAGFQVISTKLDSDTTTSYTTSGVRTYMERRLVFSHKIVHND